MMPYLIVFLGNPGKEYEYHRHNVGFRAGDIFLKSVSFEKGKTRFSSLCYEGSIAEKKICLLKPQTYMNLSGKAVQEAVHFYKLPMHHLLVIYDDFDLPFGSIRIRKKGSAGTHNGVKSIVSCLGTTEFPRIRIGIGPKPDNRNVNQFVLSDFSKEEEKKLSEILLRVSQSIENVVTQGIDGAMNMVNSSSPIKGTDMRREN